MKKYQHISIILFCLVSSEATWGFAVFDAANFGQLVISIVNQLAQIRATNERIDREVKALEKISEKIKEFSRGDTNKISDLVDQINSFRSRVRSIGYTYDGVAQQFDKIYGTKHGFQKNFQAWEKQSDDSVRDAMISQGLIEKSAQHMADLDKIIKEKRNNQGQEATLQAIGEINAIQSKQLANLSEIITTDSRAKTSVIMEDRSKNKELKNYENNLMKDFNKHSKSRPLSHFPSLGNTAPTL